MSIEIHLITFSIFRTFLFVSFLYVRRFPFPITGDIFSLLTCVCVQPILNFEEQIFDKKKTSKNKQASVELKMCHDVFVYTVVTTGNQSSLIRMNLFSP